ncbi:hypothetical protein DICVIV_01180 [Dictyocaulus viviparus]|uniref:Uncharacterized protein n=1 Tax=Dictyocaulus viviparus TaxID=29172 RepID=A0A0D8Y785_DICVI|nr:hypothetical protein DICVIV_01180 [Dictyocaulus viviparus]
MNRMKCISNTIVCGTIYCVQIDVARDCATEIVNSKLLICINRSGAVCAFQIATKKNHESNIYHLMYETLAITKRLRSARRGGRRMRTLQNNCIGCNAYVRARTHELNCVVRKPIWNLIDQPMWWVLPYLFEVQAIQQLFTVTTKIQSIFAIDLKV